MLGAFKQFYEFMSEIDYKHSEKKNIKHVIM